MHHKRNYFIVGLATLFSARWAIVQFSPNLEATRLAPVKSYTQLVGEAVRAEHSGVLLPPALGGRRTKARPTARLSFSLWEKYRHETQGLFC